MKPPRKSSWPPPSTETASPGGGISRSADDRARMIRRIDLPDVVLGSNKIGRMINRDILLQIVRSRQPISRSELANLSGLQRSTVSQIVGQLLREGWMREGPNRRSSRGRQPVMLTLNDDLVVLAADIHPSNAAVAMVDLSGRLVSSSTLPIGSNPESALRSIVNTMKSIRESHARKTLEGIGISVAGRVNTQGLRLVFAPNLHWPDCELKKVIEREMGLTTEVENAANSSLLSELWFGRMDGVRNAVLLTVSEGIGAAILAEGKLITGHYGTAGEFGHVQIDPAGPLCACGQIGCWETLASTKAAQRYYAERAPTAMDVTYHELLQLADGGDESAVVALKEQARQLGRGVRMIAQVLSPEVVLIAGQLASSWTRFGTTIEDQLREAGVPGGSPRLQPVYESEMARLRGAAALVLQRHSRCPRLKQAPTAFATNARAPVGSSL